MRPWPDSIRGWVLAVVLGGLVLSHLVAFSLYSRNRMEAIAIVGGRQVASTVATVVRLAEQAPPDELRRTVRAASSGGLKFFIAGRPLAWEQGTERLAQVVRDDLAARLEEATTILVAKGATEPHPVPGGEGERLGGMGLAIQQDVVQVMRGAPMDQWVMGSVQLKNGQWLNFAAHPDIGQGWWQGNFAMNFLIFSLAMIGLVVLAARLATRSFGAFAEAAERFGMDVNAPPFDLQGPREIRRAAQAFNEMQTRLKRFVEGRTQMFAAISHDLRTPITRMRLRAEFVEDEEQRTKMLSDLDEMESMITATLQFAREEAVQQPRERFDIAAMLADICAEEAMVGHDVTYAGPDKVRFVGHQGGLKRVFENLVTNAVKYGDRARVGLVKDGGGLVVTVDDDGPGLPGQELEKVFQPFYRLDHSRSRTSGGSGLGLAVVRNIVRAHGGEVRLENRDEGGLRAVVQLPLRKLWKK